MRARRNERRRRETRQARKQGGRNARQERNDNETRDGTAGGTIGETRERLFFLSRHSDKLNTTHENEGTPFHVSPDPLPPALSFLRTSYNPPPPRRGMSRRERILPCGRDDDRGRRWLVVPLSHCVRSLFHIYCGSVFSRRFCQLILPFRGGVYSVARGGVGRSRPSPPWNNIARK